MNEQLRKLVRESGLDDPDFPIEDWDNVPLAKFAVSIVRQCAGINLTSPFLDGEFHAREVLEHFGVEE